MKLFKTDAQPSRLAGTLLACLPFFLAAALYTAEAVYRHNQSAAENDGVSKEKIVPMPAQLVAGAKEAVFDKDSRTGQRLFLFDTIASAKRLILAYAFVMLPVLLGLHMGVFPYLEAIFKWFIGFFGKIPPLAITPIIILIFGVDELPKIMLIVIGVFPAIALTTCLAAKEIPRELIESAKSRGSSEFEIVYRIVLPLIWPKVLDSIRLSLMAGVGCLLAGEFMAATEGIGYRIYLFKRKTEIEHIIPYLMWMTLLLFTADLWLSMWIKKRYPWVNK